MQVVKGQVYGVLQVLKYWVGWKPKLKQQHRKPSSGKLEDEFSQPGENDAVKREAYKCILIFLEDVRL